MSLSTSIRLTQWNVHTKITVLAVFFAAFALQTVSAQVGAVVVSTLATGGNGTSGTLGLGGRAP
jgi:hypothetical protein